MSHHTLKRLSRRICIFLGQSLVTILLFVLLAGGLLIFEPGRAFASRGLFAPSAPDFPFTMSYQGSVSVSGQPYSGLGYFKFAITDGTVPYEWTHDGSSGTPGTSISLVVTGGLFSVILGDPVAEDDMTEPLSPDAFAGTPRYLQVWFSTDDSSFTQLPDRAIAAVPLPSAPTLPTP